MGRIVLGLILAAVLIWFFLPGLLDPDAKTPFGSKNRRSPVAGLAGPRVLVDKSYTIAEDQYVNLSFELTMPSRVTMTATHKGGPKFETYLMDADGYREWDEASGRLFGGEFHHFNDFHAVLSAKKQPGATRAGSLPAGNYVVVVENTDFGDVSPPANFFDDVATAHVKITIE